VSPLASVGLVGWPQIYRGFVERVSVRASRFLEIGVLLVELDVRDGGNLRQAPAATSAVSARWGWARSGGPAGRSG
jgi:hypothetical protein